MVAKRRSAEKKVLGVVDSAVVAVIDETGDPVVAAASATRTGLPHLDRIWVRVEVAHDGLRRGDVHGMALSERTQALINCGYLEIVAPPDGAVW